MKVFTTAGPKGGCGKSLMTLSLALAAAGHPTVGLQLKQPGAPEPPRVAIVDLNEDQGTTTDWWVQRGRPANPFLYDADGTLDELVDGLSADNWDSAARVKARRWSPKGSLSGSSTRSVV